MFWDQIQPNEAQVETWCCVFSWMGAKPSSHSCPRKAWGFLQQMRVEGGRWKLIKMFLLPIRWKLIKKFLLPKSWIFQTKIHTQTGVGARHLETHFKAIDNAKRGDGQFLKPILKPILIPILIPIFIPIFIKIFIQFFQSICCFPYGMFSLWKASQIWNIPCLPGNEILI